VEPRFKVSSRAGYGENTWFRAVRNVSTETSGLDLTGS